MKRFLSAAAGNPVFANLLMIFLLVAGGVSLFRITREMFPEFNFDRVLVTVPYPGAAPAEIEEAVTIKVEEAVRTLDGVHKVESVSSEGLATITIECDAASRDPQDVLIDVRNEVSRITTFPEDVEEPNIRLIANRREVVKLVLSGDLDEGSLTTLGKDLEQELLLLPEVSQVDVEGLRKYEMSVLVREADLQRYELTFDTVSAAIAGASLDMPLGKLRSDKEEQLLRVESRKLVGRDLGRIPVKTRSDGTRILLEDVARIQDGFQEDRQQVRLDGKPAVTFSVMRTSSQDTVRVADVVKHWAAERQKRLPDGVEIEVWRDGSQAVKDRIGMLTRNGGQGLALVFACLLLFLGLRLSFWVAFGLPVAFLTAIAILLAVGGTLNMITSFGLIMILGILVDDSIVVAENIARHMRERGYRLESALSGLREVTWPVIASVTTTAIAFLPLFFLPGIMGKFIRIMPVAVIACLLASLIECLLILPAHLAHGHAPDAQRRPTRFERWRAGFDAGFERFIAKRYGPSVDWALRNRYFMVAASFGALIVVGGLVASGRPAFIFFPQLDNEFIRCDVTMPQGTPYEQTAKVVRRMEAAAEKLRADLPQASDGKPIGRRILTRIGLGGVNTGSVEFELASSADRDLTGVEITKRWREALGPQPEVRSLAFGGVRHRPGGKPIELRVTTRHLEQGAPIARALRAKLSEYPGVHSITDNLEPGKRELRFRLKPEADTLGLTMRDMARQLQAGFIGREVHKLQRGRDELEVRVRYDADLRQRQDQLRSMRLRTSAGSGQQTQGLLPLAWAADIQLDRGLSRIERRDGERVVLVQADVDDNVANANEIVAELRETLIPELAKLHPGAQFVFGGAQEEQRDTMRGLMIGFFLALFGIYVVLALLFGSYIQPLVVMLVIPMGFGGAIVGHWLFGRPLMIFSVFGMVGLTGIVVNDALVLIDFINRARHAGSTAFEAAATTGRVRFRAVFLTTVTTVAGLLPLLLETSLQAQFVIPMAISIACGVSVATALTLYVVPCAYLILEDVRALFYERVPAEAPPEASELVQV